MIGERADAWVPLGEIAERAGVSRQAVYNHFQSREELLSAVLEHVEGRIGSTAEEEAALGAVSAAEALRAFVAVLARRNPRLWPVARAVEAVQRAKHGDEAWKQAAVRRQRLCRGIAVRLAREGLLRPGLGPATAGDLIWSLTSLRTWDELVNQRGWTAERYQQHVVELLLTGLTRPSAAEESKVADVARDRNARPLRHAKRPASGGKRARKSSTDRGRGRS